MWEHELLSRQGEGSLAQIAEERRLLLDEQPVSLTWVDRAALALTEAAIRENEDLHLLYPASAGKVSVLLAAQILIHRFLHDERSQSVGVVTSAPGSVSRAWRKLTVSSTGVRAALSETFPVWRAEPDGTSPAGDNHVLGVLVGWRCRDWRVDVTIFDRLAGRVSGSQSGPSVHLWADPFDGRLQRAADEGDLVWGWSRLILRLWPAEETAPVGRGKPFSVSEERLNTLREGMEIVPVVCQHKEAETALNNLWDDLKTLSGLAGDDPPSHVLRGLRRAWAHASTLASLPCTPSQHDKFAGLPPRAARPTDSFTSEIEAWAETLEGDLRDYASVVASDLADFRAALERDNPFLRVIGPVLDSGEEVLVILRTRTAACGLLDAIGYGPSQFEIGSAKVTWFSRLHREGSWPRAILSGVPPRSAWCRVDSGLARRLEVAVIGKSGAGRVQWAARTYREARNRLSRPELRDHVWKELFHDDPPETPEIEEPKEDRIAPEPGPEFAEETDPFSPLGKLLTDDLSLLEETGTDVAVATPSESGDWSTEIRVVRLRTTEGVILLPRSREVDRVAGDRIVTEVASELEPGARILLGREKGRYGLLESLYETLRETRPDLMQADLGRSLYKKRIAKRLVESDVGVEEFVDRIRGLGCEKSRAAVQSWLTPGDPMAPRDWEDNRYLNRALELGFSDAALRRIYEWVKNIRVFRRKAGRLLNEAAKAAAVGDGDERIEEELGVSWYDLRDAVIELEVTAVEFPDKPVPYVETGQLRQE